MPNCCTIQISFQPPNATRWHKCLIGIRALAIWTAFGIIGCMAWFGPQLLVRNGGPKLNDYINEEKHYKRITCKMGKPRPMPALEQGNDCDPTLCRIPNTSKCQQCKLIPQVSFELKETVYSAVLYEDYQHAKLGLVYPTIPGKTFICYYNEENANSGRVYLKTCNLAVVILTVVAGIIMSIVGTGTTFFLTGALLTSWIVSWVSKTVEKKQAKHRDRIIKMVDAQNFQKINKILKGYSVDSPLYSKHNRGVTLMQIAAYRGKVEVMRHLQSKGASMNTPNQCNSRIEENDDIVDIENQLHEEKKKMIRKKIEVSPRTPLHFACRGRHLEAVKYLIEQGVNVNATDMVMYTPMHFAIDEMTILECRIVCDILYALSGAGADIMHRNQKNLTLLHRACLRGWPELLTSILRCGGLCSDEVNCKQLFFLNDKLTPLSILTKRAKLFNSLFRANDYNNFLKCVRIMLLAGYNLNRDQQYTKENSTDDEITQFLASEYAKPKPLLQMCRTTIRKEIGIVRLMSKIRELPLPALLLNYIDLDDCLLICQSKTGDTQVDNI